MADMDLLISAVAFDMRDSGDFSDINVARCVQVLARSASVLAPVANKVQNGSDRAFARFVKAVRASMARA